MQTNAETATGTTTSGDELLSEVSGALADRMAQEAATPPTVEYVEAPRPVGRPRGRGNGGIPAREPAVTPALNRKLEGPEKVILHKRDADGKRVSIPREYTLADLESSPNVEAFVRQYVSASYGPGEYEITLQKRDGTLEQRGMAIIASTTVPTVDPMASMGAALDGVLKLQTIAEQQTEKRLAAQEARDEKIRAMMAEAKGANGTGSLGLPEVMLMTRMMDRPLPASNDTQATGEVLKLIMTETMRPVLAQVEAIKQKVENPMPFGPGGYPPPAPAPDMGSMFQGFAAAMQTVMPKQEQMTAADVLKIVHESRGDAFTMKDFLTALPVILASIKEIFARPPTDDSKTLRLENRLDSLTDKLIERSGKGGLGELAEGVRAVKTIAGELMPASSIADRLLDPNYIDALGNSIVGIVERVKGTPAPQTDAQGQVVAEPVPADYLNNDYPDGFNEVTAKIEECKDTLSGAKAVLASLRFLFSSNTAWKARAYKLLMVAREGNKDLALEFMTAYLNGLKQNGKVTPAKADALITVFTSGVDTFIKWAQQAGG